VGDDGTSADGKASMRAWMKAELKDVMSQVVFFESVPNAEIPGLLKQASIVLIPSLFESYSYVTVEAMCAGKAIIGSRDTGIASQIDDDVNGLLASPYHVTEWQQKIQQLINDYSLRQRLGKAAKAYADNKYMVNKEIVEYYKSIISGADKQRSFPK
jgi:glycosyltransferase involved in cell wall biosynthesis